MIAKNFPFIISAMQNFEVFGWEETVFLVIFNISPEIVENIKRGVQLFSPKNLLMTSAGPQKRLLKSESNYFIYLLYGHHTFPGTPTRGIGQKWRRTLVLYTIRFVSARGIQYTLQNSIWTTGSRDMS